MQKRTKTFLTGIVLCLAIVLGACFFIVNKPHKNVTGVMADAYVSATDLYNTYFVNEISADKQYLNKVIEVKGEVASVNWSGQNSFLLIRANDSGGINCAVIMNDSSVISQIKKGEFVTVKGRCTGFLMDVNLVDCIIIK